MIIRGTTPYHSFVVPMAPEQIRNVYVSYSQNGELILDKTKADLEIVPIILDTDTEEEGEIKESQIGLHLSQEDTLGFKFYPAAEKNIAVIQLRILDVDNEAYASEPITERISEVIKDGVIEEVTNGEQNEENTD